MLKVGAFKYEGEILAVYIIDEPGFYRIDFIRDQGNFNTEPEKIVYSQLRRKTLKVYGDPKVYESYLALLELGRNLKFDTTQTSGWEDGVFVTTITSINVKRQIEKQCIQHNGVNQSLSIRSTDASYDEHVVDHVYGIKLEPINIQDYKDSAISADTISTDTTALYHSLDTLRRRFDLSHIEVKDYVVATDINIARQRLKHWLESKNPFKVMDTETTGKDIWKYGDDELVGVVLAEDLNTSTYYPFRHKLLQNLPIDFLQEIAEALCHEEDKLTGHNTKFDRQVFLKEGYDIIFTYDTMQLSIVLDPEIKQGIHGLKHLASLANGNTYLELRDIFINPGDIDFSVLPEDLVKYYACPDGTNTLEVLYMLLKDLPDYQQTLFEMESMLANAIADHEFYGLRVNVEVYEKQYKNCNAILDKLEKAFRTLTHEDGNINSSVVLTDLIYNRMHCPVLVRTNTGLPSTSNTAIDKLASERATVPHNITEPITDLFGNEIIKAEKLANAKYPALVIFQKYRKYMKLKTAYYARFERTMKVGRVSFWVNANGAASGRQSSPMHQLPPELKAAIMSDTDEHAFWGPDYSQIEIRMIAYLAGEKDLIDLASDPDNDIHRVIGSLISGKEMWAITPEERSDGKRRNFGFVYLISGYGLAKQKYGAAPTPEQVKYCQNQLDELFHRFKRINRYIKQNADYVQKHGYMETKWLRRKRLFPQIFDPDLDPRTRSSIIRQSNNMPVQGTAADYLKLALVQMFKYIRERGWHKLGKHGYPLVRIMLSIHDEVLISADKSIPAMEIVTMITKCMEIPVKGAPPFFVQPAWMPDWGGHTDESLPMPIPLRDTLVKEYEETGVARLTYDNYRQVLDDYRKDVLVKYMDDLITKYGNDYTEVGVHVRHPSLTHQLLNLYSAELKTEHPDATHEEKITYATKYYIEGRSGNTSVVEERASSPITDNIDDLISELEELVNIDADGNVIYEESSTDADAYVLDDDGYEEIEKILNTETVYVWELADSIVFDTQAISKKDSLQKVLNYINEFRAEDGFYKTFLIYNDKLVDTTIPVENIDISAANAFMKELCAC